MTIQPTAVVSPEPRFHLHHGNVLDVYRQWPTPVTIVSDGAYGVRGFHGDTVDADGLTDWYRPHIDAWTAAAGPDTTLWFWNTEIGWATVHPLLAAAGWDYLQTVIWDKGIGHVAGNVNGQTIRRFPVVTEVCVLYARRLRLESHGVLMSVQDWMRAEWTRSGLPMSKANEACGVKSAATRKYLTKDWLWYWPPPEMIARLAAYLNEHGDPAGAPYYSVDGVHSVTEEEWARMRYTWTHRHGLTNVWQHPTLRNAERVKGSMERSAPRVHNPTAQSAAHLNQKPLELMRRIIGATTAPGDVVWEPFGGLASASVAAIEMARDAYVAEVQEQFAPLAAQRLANVTDETLAA